MPHYGIAESIGYRFDPQELTLKIDSQYCSDAVFSNRLVIYDHVFLLDLRVRRITCLSVKVTQPSLPPSSASATILANAFPLRSPDRPPPSRRRSPWLCSSSSSLCTRNYAEESEVEEEELPQER